MGPIFCDKSDAPENNPQQIQQQSYEKVIGVSSSQAKISQTLCASVSPPERRQMDHASAQRKNVQESKSCITPTSESLTLLDNIHFSEMHEPVAVPSAPPSQDVSEASITWSSHHIGLPPMVKFQNNSNIPNAQRQTILSPVGHAVINNQLFQDVHRTAYAQDAQQHLSQLPLSVVRLIEEQNQHGYMQQQQGHPYNVLAQNSLPAVGPSLSATGQNYIPTPFQYTLQPHSPSVLQQEQIQWNSNTTQASNHFALKQSASYQDPSSLISGLRNSFKADSFGNYAHSFNDNVVQHTRSERNSQLHLGGSSTIQSCHKHETPSSDTLADLSSWHASLGHAPSSSIAIHKIATSLPTAISVSPHGVQEGQQNSQDNLPQPNITLNRYPNSLCGGARDHDNNLKHMPDSLSSSTSSVWMRQSNSRSRLEKLIMDAVGRAAQEAAQCAKKPNDPKPVTFQQDSTRPLSGTVQSPETEGLINMPSILSQWVSAAASMLPSLIQIEDYVDHTIDQLGHALFSEMEHLAMGTQVIAAGVGQTQNDQSISPHRAAEMVSSALQHVTKTSGASTDGHNSNNDIGHSTFLKHSSPAEYFPQDKPMTRSCGLSKETKAKLAYLSLQYRRDDDSMPIVNCHCNSMGSSCCKNLRSISGNQLCQLINASLSKTSNKSDNLTPVLSGTVRSGSSLTVAQRNRPNSAHSSIAEPSPPSAFHKGAHKKKRSCSCSRSMHLMTPGISRSQDHVGQRLYPRLDSNSFHALTSPLDKRTSSEILCSFIEENAEDFAEDDANLSEQSYKTLINSSISSAPNQPIHTQPSSENLPKATFYTNHNVGYSNFQNKDNDGTSLQTNPSTCISFQKHHMQQRSRHDLRTSAKEMNTAMVCPDVSPVLGTSCVKPQRPAPAVPDVLVKQKASASSKANHRNMSQVEQSQLSVSDTSNVSPAVTDLKPVPKRSAPPIPTTTKPVSKVLGPQNKGFVMRMKHAFDQTARSVSTSPPRSRTALRQAPDASTQVYCNRQSQSYENPSAQRGFQAQPNRPVVQVTNPIFSATCSSKAAPAQNNLPSKLHCNSGTRSPTQRQSSRAIFNSDLRNPPENLASPSKPTPAPSFKLYSATPFKKSNFPNKKTSEVKKPSKLSPSQSKYMGSLNPKLSSQSIDVQQQLSKPPISSHRKTKDSKCALSTPGNISTPKSNLSSLTSVKNFNGATSTVNQTGNMFSSSSTTRAFLHSELMKSSISKKDKKVRAFEKAV
ncbi:hypothetical protein EGW08_001355 [Elysia chlorotica]|uniref:Uncharacterized protein n=1 Tax=Elysia chlorotica TaxID=188477 RepID=A0A433UAL8_ELYCH|nr:hypothetical protein EGW08_001355 [Elysia chlorotica]